MRFFVKRTRFFVLNTLLLFVCSFSFQSHAIFGIGRLIRHLCGGGGKGASVSSVSRSLLASSAPNEPKIGKAGFDVNYKNPHLGRDSRVNHQVRGMVEDHVAKIYEDDLYPTRGVAVPGTGNSATMFVKDYSLRNKLLAQQLHTPRVVEDVSGSTSGMGIVTKGTNLTKGFEPTGTTGLLHNKETGRSLFLLDHDDHLARTNRGLGGRYSTYTTYLEFLGNEVDFVNARAAADAALRLEYINHRSQFLAEDMKVNESLINQFLYEERLGSEHNLLGNLHYIER